MATNTYGKGAGCACVSTDATMCATMRYGEESDERCECLCHTWHDDDDSAEYPSDADEPVTVGLDCCPHMVPYGSDCDECDEDDADAAMGLTPNAELRGRPLADGPA